jgi:transcriptional regulator with XRE-family HTH domain
MSVKIRLRQFIDTEGMKIVEAAERSGIPYRSMQNYLSGDRDPGVDALTAMNTRLGVSVDWLLTGEGDRHRSTGTDKLAAETSCECTVLSLLRQLPDDDKQEIQLVVQDKKRLRDVEQQLKQVTSELADLRAS